MGIVLIRTILFYLITVVSLRIMGKRQIGELEPTELVVTILISDIATLCLQDINLPVLYALVPIVILVIFEFFASGLSLRNMAFRHALSGSYSVIINNGKIDQKEMKRAQLTLDEVMEEVRHSGAVSLNDVRFCVLETSGKMSMILKKDVREGQLPIPLIIDGTVLKENLKRLSMDRKTLDALVKQKGAKDEKEVFWLAWEDGTVTYVKKDV